MATTTPKTLYHGQPSSSAATLYTVPGATVAVIRHLRATNTDSSARTLDLWINGSDAAHQIIATKTLQAGEEWEDDVYVPLQATETLQGKASVSSTVTVLAAGAEIA